MRDLLVKFYPFLMLFPAGCYAFYALGLHFNGKPWTAMAWACYVGANVCFLMANVKGE